MSSERARHPCLVSYSGILPFTRLRPAHADSATPLRDPSKTRARFGTPLHLHGRAYAPTCHPVPLYRSSSCCPKKPGRQTPLLRGGGSRSAGIAGPLARARVRRKPASLEDSLPCRFASAASLEDSLPCRPAGLSLGVHASKIGSFSTLGESHPRLSVQPRNEEARLPAGLA